MNTNGTLHIFSNDKAMIPDDVYFTNWKNYSMEHHYHLEGTFELNYVTSGSCIYYIKDQKYILKKRNLLLINGSVPHKLIFTSPEPCLILGMSCGQYPIIPGCISLENMISAYATLKSFFSTFEDALLIRNGSSVYPILSKILTEVRGDNNWAYLNLLINNALVEISRLATQDNQQAFLYVSNAIKYMSYNYYNIEKIDNIADAVALNKVYLERIFKEITEKTIWHYLSGIRMEKAAQFLKSSTIPIGEINELIGIKSRQAFYILFKKTYGISPLEYRKRGGIIN